MTSSKRSERDRRYNQSIKGQTRNRRYEEKHPERKVRWERYRDERRAARGYQ